jgi:glutamyl-tRNA reductase
MTKFESGIVVFGLNRKTAPLHIRERASFPDAGIESYYALIRERPQIRELFILSTCNRVELYGAGAKGREVADELKSFLYKVRRIDEGSLDGYTHTKYGHDAAGHLFRVAAGLDSMILGESQVLGQIKRAYERAKRTGSVGSSLHRLIQDSIYIGKKVRTLTDISRGVTSVPGAALELIKRDKDALKDKALVIGAGKIGAMTVSRLAANGIREIVVINRDRSKAEALSKGASVRTAGFDTIEEELSGSDIVITATAASEYIITSDMIKKVLQKRPSGILLIDMGVPRNIEGGVAALSNARLYNVDDLGSMINETMRIRSFEAQKAEEIVRECICARLSLV